VSEPESEQRVDPGELFDYEASVARKRARQADLAAALHGAREPVLEDAELAWDVLVDEVVERLARRLQAPPETEPPAEAADPGPGGFDGAARQPLPPPPPSHEQTLLRVLASRAADSGAHFS
jgi:hypothetical protein